MSDRDDREKRRRLSCDAGRRQTEYTSNDRKSLNIPTGLGLWNPKKTGPYKVEFIPYAVTKSILRFKMKRFAEPGEGYYERTYWLHAGVGANKDSFVCSAKTFGKPCAICDYRGRLLQSPSKENEEIAYANRPKERQLFLLVDHAEPEKGIQLAEISNYCLGKQLDDKIRNADDEDRVRYRKFADPEEGLTVKLAASEESMGDQGRKFLWFNVDEFRTRKEELDPEWLDHDYNLDDIVREADYAEVKAAFLQTGDDDEPKKDRDDRGTRTRDEEPARGSKSRPADDEEPPARGGRVTKAEANGDGKDVTFVKGDPVEFDYREKIWTGVVVKHDVDREVVHVELEGRDKPQIVDVEDVRHLPKKKAKPAPPDDEEPPPRSKNRTRDADDDEPVTRTRNRNNEKVDDEPPPRSKNRAADDEDPPPRKRPAARDEEEEPPARGSKAPARRGEDDWDD